MLKIPQKSAAYCAILLKGGHHPEKYRYFIYKKREHPVFPKIIAHRKHGSGCIYRLLLFQPCFRN
jgi:hydroxymethylpyrimidine/phosphomethylpyrimidine kinase